MKLSIIERWLLSNQLQILELLSDDEREKASLKYKRQAIEEGYEIGNEPPIYFCPDDEVSSEEDCREVLKVLSMFRAIDNSLRTMKDKNGIDDKSLRFWGFDGNEEGQHYSFAQYFCIDGPEKRFTESFPNGVMINSHFPSLAVYRRMMAVWDIAQNKNELTKEEIQRLIDAKPYPQD